MDDGAPLWTASGNWTLEQGNWLATAGTQTSTLTLKQPVNLAALNQPVLTIRSLLQAAQGAAAQVEISLDGQNWQSVAGIAPSADWIPSTVDLSAYKGQTIWLRFTWSAPTQANETAATWRLDDVQIGEMPVVIPPTATATPSATPTLEPTSTEPPTLTPTDIPPTATDLPTETPTLEPSSTPLPTLTADAQVPTDTVTP
jgi:hypothetical protein